MRTARSALTMIAIAVAAMAGPGTALGDHCAGKDDVDDPFGSCESSKADSYGAVTCGAEHTSAGGVGFYSADPNKGGQVCNDSRGMAPVRGRVTVYRTADNGLSVASDGDDQYNPGGGKSWTRIDVRPGGGACGSGAAGGRFRQRRSSGGSWWTSGGGTTAPDGGSSQTPFLADNCA